MPYRITEKGIRSWYYAGLEQYMGQSWIDQVSMLFPSDEEVEDYGWLGAVPGLTERKGEKQVQTLREMFFQIRNREYDGGFELARKLIERDKVAQVMRKVQEAGVRGGGHWAELLSTLILAGTGSTLGNCYDGHVFFDSDHSEGDSGTQLNLLTNSEVPALNVTAPTQPTDIEATKAILGAIAYMMGYADDQGKKMNSEARQFLIQTSVTLWPYLVGATTMTTINQGDTNVLKALAAEGYRVTVVANPLLTYTTQFVIFRTDAPLRALIRQEEVPLEIQIIGDGSEEWKKNARMLVLPYARRAAGFGRWQYAAHCTLS